MNFMLKSLMAGTFLVLAQGQAQAKKMELHGRMTFDYGRKSLTYQAIPNQKDSFYLSNNHSTGSMNYVWRKGSHSSSGGSSLNKDETFSDSTKATVMFKMTRGSGASAKVEVRAKVPGSADVLCYEEYRFTNGTSWADYDAGRAFGMEMTPGSKDMYMQCMKKVVELGFRKGIEGASAQLASSGARVNWEKTIGSINLKMSQPTVSRFEDYCRISGTKDRMEYACEPITYTATCVAPVHY